MLINGNGDFNRIIDYLDYPAMMNPGLRIGSGKKSEEGVDYEHQSDR